MAFVGNHTSYALLGGSIGTALLAVVLQHESAAAPPLASGGAGELLAPLLAGERANRQQTRFENPG